MKRDTKNSVANATAFKHQTVAKNRHNATKKKKEKNGEKKISQ